MCIKSAKQMKISLCRNNLNKRNFLLPGALCNNVSIESFQMKLMQSLFVFGASNSGNYRKQRQNSSCEFSDSWSFQVVQKAPWPANDPRKLKLMFFESKTKPERETFSLFPMLLCFLFPSHSLVPVFRKEKFIINNYELCRIMLLISISMKRNCK